MKEIITYEELKEITSKAWLTVKEIMKIICVSKKEAYRLKKIIKEDLENKGYYIPNGLLPTQEVLDYLKISK
ncbi:MAG: hypothetical protein J5982_00300 [Bacilli bacterium]|nr:hypothetical protein [Bacilli bacterium]